MPILTIKLPDEDRHITFEPGRSVRDVLDETDIRVRAGCGGMGSCGLCRIRVDEGDAGEPTANELTGISAGLLAQGVRLACQVKPDHDLRIVVINPSSPSVWRRLDEGWSMALPPRTSPPPCTSAEYPLGVAVDLGTTHISMTLLDIPAGRRLAGRSCLNPQSASGADIMTRLISAQSVEQATKLSFQVIGAIGDGLRDISVQEGIDLCRVGRIVLVGNTAMLALLSGQNHQLLLQPRYWTESFDCLPVETAPWAASWGIGPESVVEVVPPLAGFVGSDLLSGVIATALMKHGPGAFLIDFGTNSEMSLWDGNNLWVTSAAGGPAFEGCGISCGMPAEPGAICSVNVSDTTGELAFDVIPGAEPQGLCGSGLVDLIACLVRNGTLNNWGQFTSSIPEYRFPLHRRDREIVLTKRDIDMLQRAKAAIGAGIKTLLAKAGMGSHELRRICIGGAFGRYLDAANAREIGLLPDIPEQFTQAAGNTALSGCEALLVSTDAEKSLREARSRAIIVNLSDCADFETLFVDHLFLQPMAET